MKHANFKTIFILLTGFAVSCENQSLYMDDLDALANQNRVYNLWNKDKGTPPNYDGFDSGPIDPGTARSWIRNYDGLPEKKTANTHFFSRTDINDLLRHENCTGLRFYYATTDDGEKLVVCGADRNGNNLIESSTLVASSYEPFVSGNSVSLADAREWTERYQRSIAENEVRSHYFGRAIISKILDQPGCEGLRVQYAWSDQGEKKLLVYGIFSGKNIAARSNDDEEMVADFSFPCPSVCPGGGTKDKKIGGKHDGGL